MFGFDVHRIGEFVPHSGAFAFRAIREIVFSVRMARSAIAMPYDVIIASSPTMFLGLAGFLCAKGRRKPFVWDVRDITWGYAADSVRLGSFLRILASALGRVLEWIARRADCVMVTNEGSQSYLESRGVACSRMLVVPNGVSRNIYDSLALVAENPPARRGRLRVVCIGLIGHMQGLSTILDVACIATELDFVIVGDGPQRLDLERRRNRDGICNVEFTGYLSPSKVFRQYGRAHVLFGQIVSGSTVSRTAVPSKIFEYLAAARPVVFATEGPAAKLLVPFQNAFVCRPGDVFAITNAIRDAIRRLDEILPVALASRVRVGEHFLRERIMESATDQLAAMFLAGQTIS